VRRRPPESDGEYTELSLMAILPGTEFGPEIAH